MRSSRFLYLVLFIFLVSACQKKDIESKEKTIGNIVLNARLESADVSNGIDFTYKIASKDSIYILEYGITEQQKYLDRIYYFSYQVENDFWLEYEGGEQKCIGAFFERNYRLTSDITLHLHFDYPEKISKDKEILLVYHAKEFGFPPVKMRFNLKT